MATSSAHPFPSRPYTTGLGRAGGGGGGTGQAAFQNTPYNSQTPHNAPQGYGAAGAAATQQQREAQRLENERRERAERERREAEERQALEALSEEQREEVNEAVCISIFMDIDQER
jgi:centrin-3